MACSKIEETAKKAYTDMVSKNVYSSTNQYNAQHPNATQAPGGNDDPMNKKGKGTGIALDTSNGGSSVDVFGDTSLPVPTGRAALYTNEFNPNNIYNCSVSPDF